MKRTVLLLLSAIVLAACAGQDKKPAAAPVPGSIASYSNDSKTLPVGAIPSAVIHDPVRNKDLEMSIEYPAKDGPYPVIIFSPQYGATNMSYVGLSAYWASHGYVVIKPRHADGGALPNPADQIPVIERGQGRGSREEGQSRERREGRSRRTQNAAQPQQPVPFRPNPAEEAWIRQTPADWQNRVADIRFIIDSLVALTGQFPEIKPRVDTSKIGVAGHGYGAFTALLIGGMKTFNAAGAATSYADPRVKAVLALSPPGPGATRGLTDLSYADLRVPVMFVTGTQDFGAVESETPAWRRQAFELSPAGDKWFFSMNGVGPAAFTGRMADVMPYQPTLNPNTYPGPTRPGMPGIDPAYTPPPQDARRMGNMTFGQQNLFNTVRTVALAFFDGYLKGLTGGRDYVGKLKDRGDAEVLSK